MPEKHQPLNLKVLTPRRLIFQGKAESIILPGEKGVFEVQSHHKRLLSRLIQGKMFIGHTKVEIRRGGSGRPVAARIAIQDGTQFRGKVEMAPRTEQIAATPLVTV